MIHKLPEDYGKNKENNLDAGPHALHFNLQQSYSFPDSLQDIVASLYVSGSISDKDLQMISIFCSDSYSTDKQIDKRVYMQHPQHLGFMKLISALALKYPIDKNIGEQFILFLEQSTYKDNYAHIDTQQFQQYRYIASILSQQREGSPIENISKHMCMYDTCEQTKFLSFLVHRFDTEHIGLIQPDFKPMDNNTKTEALLPIQEELGDAFTPITSSNQEKKISTNTLLKELMYIHLLSKTVSSSTVATCIDLCVEKGVFSNENGDMYKAFLNTPQAEPINYTSPTTEHSPISNTPQGFKRLQQYIDTAYEIQLDIHTLITDKQNVYLAHQNKSAKYKDDYTAINKQLHLPEKVGILPLFVYIRHAFSKTDMFQQLSESDDILTPQGIQDILAIPEKHILANIQHGSYIFTGNRGPSEQTALIYDYAMGLQNTISHNTARGNTDKHKPDNYVNEYQQDRTQKIDTQMAVQNLEDFFCHLRILHSICFADGIIPIITHGSIYKFLQRNMHLPPGTPKNLEATMMPRYQSHTKHDTNFFHLGNLEETLTHIQAILHTFGIHDRYVPGTKIHIQQLHDRLKGKIDTLLDTDYGDGKELVSVLFNTSTAPGIKNDQLYNYVKRYRGDILNKKHSLSHLLSTIKEALVQAWSKDKEK